jgi:hypothetical protein
MPTNRCLATLLKFTALTRRIRLAVSCGNRGLAGAPATRTSTAWHGWRAIADCGGLNRVAASRRRMTRFETT